MYISLARKAPKSCIYRWRPKLLNHAYIPGSQSYLIIYISLACKPTKSCIYPWHAKLPNRIYLAGLQSSQIVHISLARKVLLAFLLRARACSSSSVVSCCFSRPSGPAECLYGGRLWVCRQNLYVPWAFVWPTVCFPTKDR